MKNKILISAITALILLLSVNSAEAHRWHRRMHCRPTRVVVTPPVIVPRVVVRPPVRIFRPHCNNVYVYRAPRGYRHRHWR